MVPFLILIGRSNVGKSTLFNSLTSVKNVIVSNKYKLTKYRNCKIGFMGNYGYFLIDTPGFDSLFSKIYYIKNNIFLSIEESNIILFLIDALRGIFYNEKYFINFLRKKKKYIFLIINKIDNNKNFFNFYKYYELGLGFPYIISAIHNYNIDKTINSILNIYYFKKKIIKKKYINKFIKIIIIGKSNVGKSTFINLILKENFNVINNSFYTTKDNIFLNLKHKNNFFSLIDTYGLNLKFNLLNKLNNIYNVKVLKYIIISNLVLFFIDCSKKLSKQDISISKFLFKQNISIVIIINKCDLLSLKKKILYKKYVKNKFNFIDFSYIYFLSSLKNINLNYIINSFYKIYKSSIINISTKNLNKILKTYNKLIYKLNNYKLKIIYGHQGGKNPPLIIIHGKNFKKLNYFYIKFLEKQIRFKFDLKGAPLKIKFF